MQGSHALRVLCEEIDLWDVSKEELKDIWSLRLDSILDIGVTLCSNSCRDDFLFGNLADVFWIKWKHLVFLGLHLGCAEQRFIHLAWHLAHLGGNVGSLGFCLFNIICNSCPTGRLSVRHLNFE